MISDIVDRHFFDGELISSYKHDSLDTIIRFNVDSGTSPNNKRGMMNKLLFNWKEIKGYEIEYPKSHYVKEAKQVILVTARNNLPFDVYNRIYK